MATTLVSISVKRRVNHACTFTYTSSRVMSAMLQTQVAEYVASLPVRQSTNVRFVPETDIRHCDGQPLVPKADMSKCVGERMENLVGRR